MWQDNIQTCTKKSQIYHQDHTEHLNFKQQIHLSVYGLHLSRPMGKHTICIGENKDADQLRGNREADQRLCFRYMDSTIPLLSKSKISSL